MEAGPDRVVLELEPAPRVKQPLALIVVFGLLAAGAWLGATRLGGLVFGGEAAAILGGALGLALGAVAAVLLWPRLRPPERLEPVAMVGDRLRLPRAATVNGADRLDPREVLHLGFAPGRRGFLEVLTARRRYRVPLARFREPERLPELARAFHLALARLEGGPAHLAELDRSHARGARLARRRPYVTWGLLGLIGAVYVLQLVLGGLDADIFTRARVDLRLGANAAALVGEAPWRLLTGVLLHGSLLHLYMNGLALLALGGVIERLLGPARLLAIFLWSGGVGGLLSSTGHAGSYAVGASGGIFGLLGALAALHLFSREPIPAGFRQPLRWWVFIVGINLLLPVLVPVIDAWGHFGGAAAGVALGAVFGLAPRFELGAPADRRTRALAATAGAAYLVAIAAAWLHAAQPPAKHAQVLERVLLSGPGDGPLGAAGRAAAVLASPDAPRHLRRAAEARVAAAVVADDAPPELRLVWSELLEQRGAVKAAVHERWAALRAQTPGAFPALVDGLDALDALPVVIEPARAAAVELKRLPGDDRLMLALEPAATSTSALYLLHRAPGGAIESLLEVPLRPRERPLGRVGLDLPERLADSLEAGGRLEPALWAEPMSPSPTLHAVDPAARAGWRVLPDRTARP